MAPDDRERFRRGLTPLGRLLRLTGCVRFFRDGDGFGYVFRPWHPVSWMTWLAVLPYCGMVGERIGEAVPMRLSPYWEERRGEIEWM
jgi:hypothetical protein